MHLLLLARNIKRDNSKNKNRVMLISKVRIVSIMI